MARNINLTQYLVEQQRENGHIPADTKAFAINMRHWAPPVRRHIDECLAGREGPRGKDFNMRWVASMCEANPMGFLVEQAGRLARHGRQRVLDVVPTKLHERVSVTLGSKNEVERVAAYHHEASA